MKNVHKIEIKFDGEKWEKCLDNTFKKHNKDIKIDGFRKGSAPKEIFIKKMGIESLYPDAVDEAINIAYKEILEKNKDIFPVIEPQVDVTGIISKPEVKLDSYKDLGVKKEKVKVTKEEINHEIEELREQLAEVVVKEGAKVSNGDTVVIDFDGYVDGKALDGGKGENYPLEIGSHTFIPGFEEGLIGHSSNEEVTLELTFPENYVENLKGKNVTFKVKIHEIKTKVLPEVNEDFYADLGLDNVKTVEEFNSEVEKTIKERKEHEADDKFVEDLLSKAADKLEVEINPEIIDSEVHLIMENYERNLKAQGLDLQHYFEITHTTHEDLHKQLEPEAIKRLKYRYVIEYIKDNEKIDFKKSEVDKKVKEVAENYGISVEELIKAYGGIEVFKYDMCMQKALEILRENNK